MIDSSWPLAVRGRRELQLNTLGRKTGKPRRTALWFVFKDEGLFVISARRGARADWLRNLRKNPEVQVTIGNQTHTCCGSVVDDPPLMGEVWRLCRRKYHILHFILRDINPRVRGRSVLVELKPKPAGK